MSVRAKFRVESRNETVNGHAVLLFPVTTGSDENKEFYRATPAGKIELSTVNLAAGDQFVPGSEFYVDFTLATPAKPAL
jgi:hypothetical protein